MERTRIQQKNKLEKEEKSTATFNSLTRKNSKACVIGSSMFEAIGAVYADFCKETSIHGLKHTVAHNLHWFERCLWFLLTICAFFGATFCALAQLSRYNSEPVVVSMQRDYRGWWTAYPAVTACFLERVDEAKAKYIIESTWNITEDSDPNQYLYYYGFIELVADVSFRTNLQNFWKYQADDSLKGIDLLQLAFSVHPVLSLSVAVSKLDKEIKWVPVMTEMGICMTFNSQYSRFQFLADGVEWQEEEVLRCHYHSGQCYVKIDSLNNTVKVHILYQRPVPALHISRFITQISRYNSNVTD